MNVHLTRRRNYTHSLRNLDMQNSSLNWHQFYLLCAQWTTVTLWLGEGPLLWDIEVKHLVLAPAPGKLAQRKNSEFRYSFRIQLLYPGCKEMLVIFLSHQRNPGVLPQSLLGLLLLLKGFKYFTYLEGDITTLWKAAVNTCWLITPRTYIYRMNVPDVIFTINFYDFPREHLFVYPCHGNQVWELRSSGLLRSK